jgi:fructose-specific component phosphotransferase system IIB-like protein
MKNVLLGIIVGLLAGGVGAWLFLRHHASGAEAKKEEEKKEEPHVQHDDNDKVFLKLDKEFQWHADLKMAVLQAAELKPELKAFGRVLDPAPLATVLTTLAAARAQLEASGKEAERLKILFGQNQNASARSLETAEAAVKRDQLAVQAAELSLVTSWGKSIASRPQLDQLIHSLVAQENALVRVDVPPSEKLGGPPSAARLALLSASDTPMDAEFLGAAVVADPQTLGQGFLFLVKGKALPANAAVVAWLILPGDFEKGVVVPRDAIVRHEGEAFVYVQTTDETFERFEVTLRHPLAAGWFTDELKPGVKIVINGAQQLLSEELKGEGGGE